MGRPTVGLGTATWVPGTAAHSWQAVAAGGVSISTKGMMLAAKVLAATSIDLFSDAAIIERARREFEDRRGPGFVCTSLIGDRAPPLDYRRTTAPDRYAIECDIGAGGMATVYLADDLKHHRRVSVKVLRPDLAALGLSSDDEPRLGHRLWAEG